MRSPQPGREYADGSLLEAAMAGFVEGAESGQVSWLTKDGVRVGAIVPLDVAEAGLRALGRDEPPMSAPGE
ncbi:hypothetical protein ACVGOW_33290 [Pseudonocardia saturnea]